MNLKHKEIIEEEELLNNVDRLNQKYPNMIIPVEKYKELRKQYLKLNTRDEQLRWLKSLTVYK